MDKLAYLEMSRIEESHWWFVGRRYFINKRLQKIDEKNLDILEVGCGTGGNLELLKSFGRVSAIETNEKAREHSKRVKNVKILDGSLPDDNPFLHRKFDIIALFDVLEHIEDDLAALQSLKKCLKKGGRVILTVPAYMFLWSYHDEYHHHFRRYSRNSLSLLCEQGGYELKVLTGFNSLLLPVAIMFRLLSKLTTTNKPIGAKASDGIVNGILKFLFKAEIKLNDARGWPFGLSIYAELKAK